ncbi:hypothetical protein FBUS_11675 [Fasciolopsis buskii]|uniref:Uncharacterized protein n=1 Tax=Fasciolopsis buskii TaxID=27845 RepID=A0A8E0RZM3_9TREM|nr:hypothetical protein FBUS_11675 [Fasciolopsis buski]
MAPRLVAGGAIHGTIGNVRDLVIAVIATIATIDVDIHEIGHPTAAPAIMGHSHLVYRYPTMATFQELLFRRWDPDRAVVLAARLVHQTATETHVTAIECSVYSRSSPLI